ncbi:alpha/beta hydrolase [Lacihabitans sp. CCS-44]|uniref:alpha/beta fold hydrolase n=1 Tax=Lacihabitans sp. CCS-44 TaxID=2487331 RepID=UPI0020CFBC18|nr:alpha/beta hydrolase [Lacihabitans sp. CCS-44]MCP9757231.1 alpha/beta hydrolase [Lacihabitans sp. CCS-44]
MISRILITSVFVLFMLTIQAQKPLIRAFQPPTVVNKIPYGNNPKVGKYAQTKDAKIYYEVYGKGQPVVLLHGGLFGSTVEFADFIDKLKTNFQVIAISTRGHGKSELGTESMTLDQRASDALAVIDAITKEKVTIIGFSDGGYAAYHFAKLFPERVNKMVVIGAGELTPGNREFNFTAEMALKMDKAFIEQQQKLMPEPARLSEMFSELCAYYNTLSISKELLSTIKCPVLVMAGDKDGGNPVERVVSAARFIPNHQICIIPNTGHGCHNDNFEATWASIAPFLKN